MGTVRQALDLAAEYERMGPAKTMPVQEVHVADDGGLVLEVGKPPVALYVGKGPFRKPLEQASRVLAEVARRHAQAEVIFADNLAHPERVVVRMR
jgi:cell division protein FtsQ